MIDTESAGLIAGAVWTEDTANMSAGELDELAILHWEGDPDVEWDELGLSADAGEEGHGDNTEEEKLQTLEEDA